MTRNLTIVFSTFLIKNDSERLEEYAACYKQLLRILPENFDVVFVDNSLNNLDEINNLDLRSILLQQKVIFASHNKGLKNKGVGELSMLAEVSKQIDFLQYDNICYCTGRKFFTCPYAFEKAVNSVKLATVSNPDYLFLDGTLLNSAPNMFNDMFFSMKSHLMLKFISETEPRLEEMENCMINSESNLFDFISRNKIDVQLLNFLGLIRSDRQCMPEKSIYHIC